MKIKQLDGGFKGVHKKDSRAIPSDSAASAEKGSRAISNRQAASAASPPQPRENSSTQSKGVTLKESLTPQYIGYVERELVPVLKRMGFEGDRLNTKKVNNIKGLYSEIINSSPGNDMATAYAYLAVLLTWHDVTPDPKAMDEFYKNEDKEVRPSQRAYYKERLAICSTCPEAYETLGRIRCAKCNCFMELKAFLKASQCPLKKW